MATHGNLRPAVKTALTAKASVHDLTGDLCGFVLARYSRAHPLERLDVARRAVVVRAMFTLESVAPFCRCAPRPVGRPAQVGFGRFDGAASFKGPSRP
jgi:hypothetical protein